jgi:GntR family transcriptional regulator, transcriptional repressor for pyruvate dehydrogenase complex
MFRQGRFLLHHHRPRFLFLMEATALFERTSLFESLEIRREHLHLQIADSIQAMIAEGRLLPGSRVPPERDLAEMLGVNRATVHQALHLLQQRGLVEMKVGSGTYVTHVSHSVLTECLERYLVFNDGMHEDLITLREILEPEMAALAARRATPTDVDKLNETVEKLESRFADEGSWPSEDMAFHEALAEASHNELIVAITKGLQNVMRSWLKAMGKQSWKPGGMQSHRQICEAITAHDPQAALEAMRLHMHFVRPEFDMPASDASIMQEGDQP